MVHNDDFSKFIKNKRMALGFTQEQMAEKVVGDGRRRSYISAIETGKTHPEWPTIVAMLNALGCGITFTE